MPLRHPRALALAAVVLLSVGVSLADPALAESPTGGAVPTCNGRTVTVSGQAGASLLGTSGDDVVLTNGASRVDTGAGDDSICVTGSGPVEVNAGPGDDFVGARTHRGRTFVSLGFGDDTFIGGRGIDRVWSQEASNQTSPDDHDVVIANGGDDVVISGSSATSDNDVVQLGPGNDTLITYGTVTGAALDGGIGLNTFQPLPGPDLRGDWTFDNVEGVATMDQLNELTWSSFQRFDLTGLQGDKLRFLGSRASEWVLAGGVCRAVLRGRAGDDQLSVDTEGCNGQPAGDAVLVGGPGKDELTGSAGNDVLRGGGGQDRADGAAGDDRCVAVEMAISCS